MGTPTKKSVIGKIILALCGLILLYAFLNSFIADILIKRNGSCIYAYIYKQTFGGKTSSSFGYKFDVGSKTYEGLMPEDKLHKVGDSICVVYCLNFPRFNRPISYFDHSQLKCGCK